VRLPALAAAAVAVPWIPAAPTGYAHTHMPASHVRLVVVHVTEGSYDATVAWFRNRRSHVASHYVVGRDGRVVQMVSTARPAWHAGDHYANFHSIGVEHEGYTYVDGTIGDAEYRASARLVASLLKRYHLPADRRHVIGHAEVGGHGGYSHHTDPGPYWDWQRYLSYVRTYRAGGTPPPRPVDVTIPGLVLNQAVTGLVTWNAAATGAQRVDFLVDGVPRASVAAAPFAWAWDTALENDGRHVLTARAVAADGRSAISTVVVRSQTPPPPPPTATLPEPLPPLAGLVALTPVLSGGPVAKVELWVDGVLVQTVEAAPWTLTWTAVPGPHTLAVRAVGPRGNATADVRVVEVPVP
jgi:hypothetical protein